MYLFMIDFKMKLIAVLKRSNFTKITHNIHVESKSSYLSLQQSTIRLREGLRVDTISRRWRLADKQKQQDSCKIF